MRNYVSTVLWHTNAAVHNPHGLSLFTIDGDDKVISPSVLLYWSMLFNFDLFPNPYQGEGYGKHFRFWSGKVLMAVVGIYSAAYLLKYNGNVSISNVIEHMGDRTLPQRLHWRLFVAQDWTRKGGWRVLSSRTATNQGEQQFPKTSDRSQPSDYASRGFNKSVLA